MATVHPSRLGLVPGARVRRPSPPPPSREEELRLKLLERRRDRGDEESRPHNVGSTTIGGHPAPDGHERSVRREGHRSRHQDEDSRRESHDSPRKGHSHPRSPSPRHRDRDRSPRRDRSPYRERHEDRGGRSRDIDERADDRSRRASPSYRAYDPPTASREAPYIPLNGNVQNGGGPDPSRYGYGGQRSDLNTQSMPPWRDNSRNGWQAPPPPRGGFSGSMDFERRRLEREANPFSIWPPSPKYPYRDEEERDADRKERRKAKKSSKALKTSKRRSRRYSDEDTESETDSEDEARRKRKRRKERERRKRYSDEEDSGDERRQNKHEGRDSKRGRQPEDHAAEQWVEKGGEVVVDPKSGVRAQVVLPPADLIDDDDEEEDEIGPHLPVEGKEAGYRRSAFSHMLKGEGEAMAVFAESGQRIPRRGEIGLDSNTIEQFETSGYVMSGSRHKVMNAVRMRKENQVINEQEKRAILRLQKEEKQRKEAMILSQFKEMLDEGVRQGEARNVQDK